MGAIVRIETTTPEAAKALIEVAYDDPAIYLIELGQNSPMHEVVFQSPSVPIGTGFVTLQRLLNEHTQGAGAGIVPVALG
jgi:hypothetical protein